MHDLNFYHQTYWNQPDNNRYSLSLAKYFDLGKFKNLSVNLTAFRTSYQNTNDDGVYIALSVPWGETSTVSFNSSWDKSNTTQNINYYDRINERSNYQINTGVARSGAIIGGYYTYQGDMAQVNANATYQQNRYRSAGLSIQGGLTATQHGVALHRSNQLGASRVFVDTSGVPNIPLRGNGIVTRSNYFGKAVIADVNSYYRSNINVDLNLLPNKAEITHSVKQGTLTEGAIGYRQFDVITGNSAMATIRLSDNSAPPFGAIVLNARKQQVGIISDEGSVYLSGLNPKEKLNISWDNEIQCNITLPDSVSSEINLANTLLLPCIK
ncbi:fimbria/pilus outer membrane usher protein [Providencia rettgeri]|uniref:fimbria/pilus outer membrane usher protein n=1 Tax=Providencia rettgeri TaxID=587 RepID=UPI001C219A0A|nr:fimbria/pilus outer membrane usher protein [Providencia rettgeri]QXB07751.1 fimbria/pilus outer membrane usher protein [Providencia rettgeri]